VCVAVTRARPAACVWGVWVVFEKGGGNTLCSSQGMDHVVCGLCS
jgi:hypothetical protein